MSRPNKVYAKTVFDHDFPRGHSGRELTAEAILEVNGKTGRGALSEREKVFLLGAALTMFPSNENIRWAYLRRGGITQDEEGIIVHGVPAYGKWYTLRVHPLGESRSFNECRAEKPPRGAVPTAMASVQTATAIYHQVALCSSEPEGQEPRYFLRNQMQNGMFLDDEINHGRGFAAQRTIKVSISSHDLERSFKARQLNSILGIATARKRLWRVDPDYTSNAELSPLGPILFGDHFLSVGHALAMISSVAQGNPQLTDSQVYLALPTSRQTQVATLIQSDSMVELAFNTWILGPKRYPGFRVSVLRSVDSLEHFLR